MDICEVSSTLLNPNIFNFSSQTAKKKHFQDFNFSPHKEKSDENFTKYTLMFEERTT
jgi:hypothetical protein